MAGGDPGQLALYGNLKAGMTGSLTVIDSAYGKLDLGNRSSPALADLDGDGKFELIVGSQRGGLELFHTNLQTGTTGTLLPPIVAEKPYQILYSSTEDLIEIAWKIDPPGNVELVNALGRVLNIEVDQNEIVQKINLASLPPAIYFLRLRIGQKIYVEKVVDRQ